MENFPENVLHKIIGYLALNDIGHLAATSSHVNVAVMKDQFLWLDLWRRDYDMGLYAHDENNQDGFSYKELYQRKKEMRDYLSFLFW